MTREEAVLILKVFMDNPLFSNEHKAAFNIAIHDIEQRHEWDINELMLIPKSESKYDDEILKAHSDGAREVLDNVREEIEQLEMYGVLFSDKQTAIHIDKAKVLEIIDKYR